MKQQPHPSSPPSSPHLSSNPCLLLATRRTPATADGLTAHTAEERLGPRQTLPVQEGEQKAGSAALILSAIRNGLQKRDARFGAEGVTVPRRKAWGGVIFGELLE